MARFGDLDTQYFDDAGDPLINGKVYFYETGTSTPKTTYSDVNFATPNTNPVILTAAGRQPNVFFRGVAKAVLATSAGTQILVRDPVGETDTTFGNPWVSSKSYNANDVVQGSNGVFYVSLINGNVNNDPVTTSGSWTFLYSVEWSAGTTYKEGSVVTYDSIVYQSLQNANINKNPVTETSYWTAIQLSWISTVTYALNANVVASDGVLYTSIQAANTNHEPSASPLWWVGTSAAAAASASDALASEGAASASEGAASASAVAAAASASTATTQASNASASAGTATTQASNASASAVAAAASQVASASSASASSVSAAAALASQIAAAASAAAALASENAAELAEANATGIVYGGGYSTTPVASNVPIADASGTLENWINPSINKVTTALARAVQVSITAATSASNGIQQLTNVQNNFGTGNFALQWRGSVPDWTPAANVILINKHDGTNGYILTLLTTGILRTTINGTNYDSTVATGMTDNYVAVIDVDITRSSASAAGSVVYTLNGVILGASVAISVGAPVTVDNTSSLYVCGTSAVRSASQWFGHRLFNRAKTVAENLGMLVKGMAAADAGASQTAIYTSDFSAGTDSYAAGGGNTLTGDVDGINGSDNWCRLQRTSVAGNVDCTRAATSASGNKKQTIRIFNPPGSPITHVRVSANASTLLIADSTIAVAANTEVYTTVYYQTTAANSALTIVATNSAGSAVSIAAGNPIYFKDVVYNSAGITSELLAQNAQTDNGQVLDSSGNKQHSKLAESGMSTLGAISARRREVRWTNTWAGTHELQYIGGINQAILPSNAYIESIVGTVSGATVEDIIIGDGSDTDRYVTITTALAAGTNTFTIASRTTDGTNLKLTVDPDANATMSIAWVITYYRLEG